MVFHWLKGLASSAPEESKEDKSAEQPTGLSTIDLNPFGSIDRVMDDSLGPTVMLPELKDEGITEVWQSLEQQENNVNVSIASANDPEHGQSHLELSLIPSLRTHANRLKLQAEISSGTDIPELWRAYLQLVPSDSNAWLSLGEYYLENGALLEAKNVFRRAAELQPEDGITLGALGHTLLMLGETSEARSCLEDACTFTPNEIGLHEALLSCLEADGDIEAAQRKFIAIEDMKRGQT